MDARVYDQTAAASAPPTPLSSLAPAIDLHHHIAVFRRRSRLFLAVAVAVFIVTVIATFQLTPRYTATGEVMLDPRQEKVTDVQEVLSGLPADTTAVDSEVDVIKSRDLAEKVVAALHLDSDPEFNGSLRPVKFPKTLWTPKRKGLVALTPQQQVKVHDSVVDAAMNGLKVARSGLTYGIKVSYTSTSAAKAAVLANAFADHYLLEQLDAKFDATRRASDWLNERLTGLKAQVEQADAAVARYKSSHGLMGLATGGDGNTIAQQEISTLDTQLATAKAQQAEANANLTTAQQQLAKGSSGDDLAASLGSITINNLRQQRAVISAQVADMQGRYGNLHPELLKAKRQLSDIDGQIQSEIKRITSNLEAQAQVANQRAASMEHSLAGAKGTLSENGAASVGLSDLERNATSLSTLYQNYLDRFKQTQSQQGIQQSDAHVISRAKAPNAPSFPNKSLSVALGLVLAVASALGLTVLLAALDVGLNTSEDVERLLGESYLGSVPLLGSVKVGKMDAETAKLSPMEMVVAKPLSSFAESFRNLRTSIVVSKLGEPVHVVAVTSSLPGEGKTTTCICLGRVLAMGGTSAVVVDCDLRRRSMNQIFEVGPKLGLMEVLAGLCSLDDALQKDAKTGAVFLPLADAKYTAKDVFSSVAMDKLLVELRARFDIVILDTAPVLPVADTRVLAPKADVTVFLAHWRKTPRKAVENALKQIESAGAHVAGVALTQMDMKEQARSGYGDAGYYYGAYQKYYST